MKSVEQKNGNLNVPDRSSIIVPETEGIKYTGSKRKIIPFILQSINGRGFRSVLDGFTGTTRVAQAFAQSGYAVTANDRAVWSEVFANCYLKSELPNTFFQKILDKLNALPGIDGWFTEHYGGMEKDTKMPFQRHNTMKLDAIRLAIEDFDLPFPEKCVLLTSLIYAMDAVDSTLGHFSSSLAHWSPRSYQTMKMTLPRRFQTDPAIHTVLCGDIFEAIQNRSFDAAYLDPPYGSNNEKMPPSRVRYNAYYHFWKTVILNDHPELFGKAGRRTDSKDTVSASVFEEFRKDENGHFLAVNALSKLIQCIQANFVLLSYSSGGRATKQDLLDLLQTVGKIEKVFEINYRKNVMSGMRWTNEWISRDTENYEYLFLLKK